jgi:hypothetical protein
MRFIIGCLIFINFVALFYWTFFLTSINEGIKKLRDITVQDIVMVLFSFPMFFFVLLVFFATYIADKLHNKVKPILSRKIFK